MGINHQGYSPETTQSIFNKFSKYFAKSDTIYYGYSPQRSRKIILGVLSLVLVLSIDYFSNMFEAMSLTGPSLVAPLNDEIFITTSNHLYHFNIEGILKHQYELKKLGIQDGVTEISAIDDRHLLIGDWKTGQIKRCHLEGGICRNRIFQKMKPINYLFLVGLNLC